MCLVSAEMMPGSISGVGYLITHAYTVAQTDVVITRMIAWMICIFAVLYFLFRILNRSGNGNRANREALRRFIAGSNAETLRS